MSELSYFSIEGAGQNSFKVPNIFVRMEDGRLQFDKTTVREKLRESLEWGIHLAGMSGQLYSLSWRDNADETDREFILAVPLSQRPCDENRRGHVSIPVWILMKGLNCLDAPRFVYNNVMETMPVRKYRLTGADYVSWYAGSELNALAAEWKAEWKKTRVSAEEMLCRLKNSGEKMPWINLEGVRILDHPVAHDCDEHGNVGSFTIGIELPDASTVLLSQDGILRNWSFHQNPRAAEMHRPGRA